MHTYRKANGSDWLWEVGYYHPPDATGEFVQLGPKFGVECEAAAYASFLNGGRYSPGEISPIFAEDGDDEDDNDVHPARPKSLEDYPVDRRG